MDVRSLLEWEELRERRTGRKIAHILAAAVCALVTVVMFWAGLRTMMIDPYQARVLAGLSLIATSIVYGHFTACFIRDLRKENKT